MLEGKNLVGEERVCLDEAAEFFSTTRSDYGLD